MPKELTTLNPVDGMPEWEGAPVVPMWRKRRDARRSRRFVIAEWGELLADVNLLRAPRAQRLLFVLYLHRNLAKSKNAAGWCVPTRADLAAMGLADSDFYKAVARLEMLGRVEVRRRPGKRSLLRLIDKP